MKKKIKNKIYNWENLKVDCIQWRNLGQKMVFTNGCFDILHKGHVSYLEEAAGLGDKLIIGLNSDRSINQLKGSHRPIQDEEGRLCVIAALEMVDAVVIFDQDTPEKLIEYISPDVLVKGGDWSIDQIVGSHHVIANGGNVISLNFITGYSTTAIEQKIKGQC